MYSEAEKALREGKIVLVSPLGNNGDYLLGVRIPFFMVGQTMYVNMTRWGKWSDDKLTYNISPASELSPIMQGAYITYKFLSNQQRLLSEPRIEEMATRIHVEIMIKLLQKLGIIINNASQDDNTTYLRYLSAKFFLRYVLKKDQTESVDNLAFKVAKVSSINKVTLELLQMREDGDGFLDDSNKYETFSGFLSAIMESTRSNLTITSAVVLSSFTFLYGEQAYHSITYFPYLLYFLEIALKGAPLRKLKDSLMSMRSLSAYLQQLEKEIIAKS